MGIDTLEKQHQELLATSAKLLAALPDDEIPDAVAIKALLLQLLGRLSFHLATEDEQVYPLLLNHRDAQVRAVAQRFQQELGGLARGVDAYKAKWSSVPAIQKQPAEFSHHTRVLLAALAQRIQKEDEELYVLLQNRCPPAAKRHQE